MGSPFLYSIFSIAILQENIYNNRNQLKFNSFKPYTYLNNLCHIAKGDLFLGLLFCVFEKEKSMKQLKTLEEATSFLTKLNETDLWQKCILSQSKLTYVQIADPKEIDQYIKSTLFPNCHPDCIKEAVLRGVLVLSFKENDFVISNGKVFEKVENYLVSTDAIPSLLERLGIKGSTITYLLKNYEYERLTEIYNFLNASKFRGYLAEKMKFLHRDGFIRAVFSDRYKEEPQIQLLEKIHSVLLELMPNATFKEGRYQLDYSSFEWSLGDLNSDVLSNFKTEMLSAGFNIPNESNLEVIIRAETSDLGNFPITIAPYMEYYGRKILISFPYKFKHFEKAKKTEKAVTEILSLIESETEKVGKLLNQEIKHPYRAALKALLDIDLNTVSKQLCYQLLNAVEQSLGECTSNAFMIFTILSNVENSDIYMAMNLQKKMLIKEKLCTLSSINWEDADRSNLESI